MLSTSATDELQQKLIRQSPIGIFDSGVGGLSVLRHIRQQLPDEALCYFADAGFAPYGDKPESVITERTLLIAQFLIGRGVKALVVACNTATAAAIKLLRAQFPELILIGVEPGVKPAARLSHTGCVGVLATSSTLASSKYQALCAQVQRTTQIRFIHQACPGLADLIERGELNTPATMQLLETYLRPMLQAGADTIVLGCTHYPFVEETIRRIAASHLLQQVELVDTGLAVARQLQRLLTDQHKLSQPGHQSPPLQFYTSGTPEKLTLALQQLLNIAPTDYSAQKMFAI